MIHARLDKRKFILQVEMLRNPQLRGKPLGIQQKYIVVTCNYKAREYGVTKLMSIKDAKEKCPQLILVNGEDLTHYREMSYKISEFLQKYTPNVERLGFDENFLDVSEMVKQRIDSSNHEFKGHIYKGDCGEGEQPITCDCGCSQRLMIGSEIANDIRCSLYDELNITCCAGISYNKLLSKLVGEQHKPNQQTTLLPDQTQQFMFYMKKASKIPGVGSTMSKKLARLGVVSIEQLQEVPVSQLVPEIGEIQALTIKQLSYGVDDSPVVPYGRPQTLSDEDSFKKCSTVSEIKAKAVELIKKLLPRLLEDGRFVQTIRLTIRKFTSENKWGNRESRQCPVPHHIAVKITQGKTDLILPELEKLIMGLFTKLVDINTPFHLTLMNIGFCNLTDKPKNSIENFMSPKRSGTSADNNFLKPDVVNVSQTSVNPNQKDKNLTTKIGIKTFFTTQQQKVDGNLQHEDKIDNQSKSERKRKVDDNFSQNKTKKCKFEDVDIISMSLSNENFVGNVDKDVFDQLPTDIQNEIFQSQAADNHGSFKTTTISAASLKNNETKHTSDADSSDKGSNTCFEDDLKGKLLKAGINVEDFYTFPSDVQKDILEQYKISLKHTPKKGPKKSILNYFTAKNNK